MLIIAQDKIIVTMMEKTTFFLLAVMLQCTWPKQCTKNSPKHSFGVIHLVRTYLMANFSTLLPLYALAHIFDGLPQLRTYLMDDLFLNQKTNNNIRISYSLKYKHSNKENTFFKSYTCSKTLHLISVTLSHINSIIIVQHYYSTL